MLFTENRRERKMGFLSAASLFLDAVYKMHTCAGDFVQRSGVEELPYLITSDDSQHILFTFFVGGKSKKSCNIFFSSTPGETRIFGQSN